MSLKWSESYEVGNDTIDRHHRELFRVFGELQDAIRLGKGKAKLEEIIDFLEVYTVFHFDAEEALMIETLYPPYPGHRLAHTEFIRKVQQLKDLLQSEGPTIDLLLTTNEALLHWLIEHIHVVDKEFGTYLLDRPTTP